ncbi:carboxypeptidase regulatory-like domain-containing protein [Acidipila sp. EB88]|uniref:carboxypeptidase regulatory-like domain-containing protein n=1 Tax=Acidipila sp. EB88 TaxID=2305226 RepID=UPI000F5E788C|nr:carboxypeptidase regulatory-like domain-containing protein [Acidipila sp. EB88]RRA49582.1 TonB-dependent receptor [Acidipila sp. EB88]
MQTHLCRSFFAAFLLLCCWNPLRAQEVAATLTGNVTDASGAVIPNAHVEIDNAAVKGSSRVATTDKDGSYTVTNLPPAGYVIIVTAPGFKSFTAQNVTIYVAEKRTVNARLEPGAVSENVTVQQNTVAVDTSTSEQSGTVSGTQVRELELSNRNFEQLVTLQPGVVSGLSDEVGFGLNNSSTVSVNGARSTSNNWTVDGADINDSGSNGTLLNVPSVDAIQEFTLARGSYDASYGRSGGGQVLVATKAGTSEFHGDLYEFGRNTIFNANDYFANQTGTPRGVEHYNNYGFTLGGPLYIPRLYNTGKNKTYFFWSEEWRKVSSPTTSSITAPTTAQLNGIVSGQVTGAPAGCVSYDPAANQSTISPTCYSNNSKVYLANVFDAFPANSGGNYVFTYSSLNNFRQDIVRLDQAVNEKIHLFARAIQDETPENFPTGLFAGANYPGLDSTAVNAPGENVVGNLTYTISPSLVNEAEFAYSQGTITATLSGVANSPTVLNQLTNNTPYKDPYGRIPSVTFTGGTITGLAQGDAPYFERNLDRTFFDNLSLTKAQHTLRFGYTFSQMLKTENASEGDASFNFNSWQDFLLGNVSVYQQASRDIIPDLHYFNMEAYAQDDWKVSRRLTLNLGMRWSYFPSPTDVNNTLNNFDPTLYNGSLAPAIDVDGNFVAGQSTTPATYANGLIFPTGTACAQAKAIAPGVSCSPYGARVNPNSNANFAPRVGFALDVFGTGKTSLRGGFGTFFDRSLNGIWEQNAFADPPLVQTSTINNTSFDNPLQGTSAVSLAPNRLTSTGNPGFKVPSYADYNLSLQQEVTPSTVFELSYVGSSGRHLLGELDLNQPTLAARASNPAANVNAVRPYLGYSYFQARIPAFTSSYNSLQASLNHRVTRGLTLGIAYTWSRNLSDQSNDRGTANTDTYDPKLDYGPTTLNTPNVFIANYVYQLPFFAQQHGILGHTLGGWEVSGITTFESGHSATVTQAGDPFACVASTTSATGCVAGTYPGGLGIATPNADIAPRPDQVAPVHMTKTQGQWFSTASFAKAVGHFGTERTGSFLGPGIENWDLGAMKNVDFKERYRFQFRGEFFNAFNHANFDDVDTNLNDASFGQVTTTHLPRRIQLGAKLYF